MKHYSYSELDMYRNKTMPLRQRIMCRWHLRKCEVCRELQKNIEQDEELIEQVRKVYLREDFRQEGEE